MVNFLQILQNNYSYISQEPIRFFSCIFITVGLLALSDFKMPLHQFICHFWCHFSLIHVVILSICHNCVLLCVTFHTFIITDADLEWSIFYLIGGISNDHTSFLFYVLLANIFWNKFFYDFKFVQHVNTLSQLNHSVKSNHLLVGMMDDRILICFVIITKQSKLQIVTASITTCNYKRLQCVSRYGSQTQLVIIIWWYLDPQGTRYV